MFENNLNTAFAVQGISVLHWGHLLIDTIPAVEQYLKQSGRSVTENLDTMHYFVDSWKNYLKLRKIDNTSCTAEFPSGMPSASNLTEVGHSNITERDKFYHSLSWSGWGGSGGNDSYIKSDA